MDENLKKLKDVYSQRQIYYNIVDNRAKKENKTNNNSVFDDDKDILINKRVSIFLESG